MLYVVTGASVDIQCSRAVSDSPKSLPYQVLSELHYNQVGAHPAVIKLVYQFCIRPKFICSWLKVADYRLGAVCTTKIHPSPLRFVLSILLCISVIANHLIEARQHHLHSTLVQAT